MLDVVGGACQVLLDKTIDERGLAAALRTVDEKQVLRLLRNLIREEAHLAYAVYEWGNVGNFQTGASFGRNLPRLWHKWLFMAMRGDSAHPPFLDNLDPHMLIMTG